MTGEISAESGGRGYPSISSDTFVDGTTKAPSPAIFMTRSIPVRRNPVSQTAIWKTE